jgi:hypothetical protein
MPVETTYDLKAFLFDAYGGFADKRYKNLNLDLPFIVDDRTPNDQDSRGQLYLWFCQMFVTVEQADLVRLLIGRSLPSSPAVQAWFDDQGAEASAKGIEVRISPQNLGAIDDLVAREAAILKRRYEIKAYKFVVPRVCNSLSRLKTQLNEAWS